MKKLEELKIIDVVLFSLTIVTFVIGVDQVLRYKNYLEGLGNSYWIFSISLIFLMIYNLRKQKREEKEDTKTLDNPAKTSQKASSSPKKTVRRK
jgi:hypothetical protein